jgi:hypothetical protein
MGAESIIHITSQREMQKKGKKEDPDSGQTFARRSAVWQKQIKFNLNETQSGFDG